jgi:mono/diheme cytochrome c family protein
MAEPRGPFGFLLSATLLAAGLAPKVASAADGAAIYAEHCAGCHGKEGHGDGPTAAELKYKPRDFKEGKFAFGNTTDAMVKTIMSGIPGEEQARMPAFKSILSVAEIESVVVLVRTMMPAEVVPTPADMKMEPRDGPLFARGIVAPLKEGDPPIPRALLVGLPSGFTLEYATDSVRLLAVRRGEFVTRSDWEGRGGKPLTPLGAVLFAPLQPGEWSAFVVLEPAAGDQKPAGVRPLRARLRATSTARGVA